MELIAALIVFGAVVSFVLAIGGRQQTARARLDAIRPRSEMVQADDTPQPMSARVFAPAASAIAGQAARLMPAGTLQGIEHKLILAGEPITVNGFIMMRLICGFMFLALPMVIVLSGAMQMSLTTIGVVIGFAVIGLVLPGMWLSSRVGQRQKQIIKSLPDAFDLITTCVEAGLGLDAALARVAEKVEGPFADELSRMLHEVGLGKMRSEALRELSDRTGVPDLTTFVNAVIQAERMGSSVGLVLRVQADQLRVRRRQRAEQQAYKAPVKMIFPLVLCIFPTLFIVILGPAAITIMRDFPTK